MTTPRLLLRRWRESDLEPFAAMNADPEVMEFFPSTLTPQESAAMVEKTEASFETEGFGLWAAELRGDFIGYVGLSRPRFQADFTPCVEIGWRLARPFWGQGLATEAATHVLKDGFERLQLPAILSWTATLNTRSVRVMERLGMSPAGEFLHPLVEGPLKLHVLFRKRSGR